MSMTAPSTAISSGCGASSAPWIPSSRRSRRSTGSDTALERNDEKDLATRWSGRWMLLHRILAVNIFALAILAGSLFYLDGFRRRLTDQGLTNAGTEVRMAADALALAQPNQRQALLTRLGFHSQTRLRVFGADGRLLLDSWTGSQPTYDLTDPAQESWRKTFARKLDHTFETVVGSRRPPLLATPEGGSLDAWPEAQQALAGNQITTMLREAPEGSPFIAAAMPVVGQHQVLLLTRNARGIRRVVREERSTLGLVLLVTIVV